MNWYNSSKNRIILCVLICAIILLLPEMANAFGFSTVIPFKGNCGSVSSKAASFSRDPWWSAPFDLVSSASVGFATSTFDKVATSMIKVIGVGLALWLGIFTLKVVGSMTESSPLDNVGKIFTMMFKACFACILLKHSNELFTYFVAPIIQFGTGLGGVSSGGDSAGGLFDATSAMKSVLYQTTAQVANTHGKGAVLMCASRVIELDLALFQIYLPDPGAFGNGCTLWFITWVMSIVWPLLIFDALVRLGVTAALTPLFVGAWVFPSTRNYTQLGFNSFLNVAFFCVFLNFVITIGLKILEGSADVGNMSDDANSVKEVVCKTMLFHSQHCNGTEPSQSNVLILMGACFYAFYILKEATTFANYFSSTQFTNDSGFKAGMGAISMAKKGAGLAKKGVVKGIDKAKQDISRSQVRKFNAFQTGAAKGDYNKLSDKDKKSMMKVEKKLRQKGILNSVTGEQTAEYGALLKMGRRRTFANWVSRGKFYKDNKSQYDTWVTTNNAKKNNE